MIVLSNWFTSSPSPPPPFQVMAGHPHNGQERGEHVLNCMTAIVPNLHEDLVDLWDAVIPKLLSYLNGNCVYHHCSLFKYCSSEVFVMGTGAPSCPRAEIERLRLWREPCFQNQICARVTVADEGLNRQSFILRRDVVVLLHM